MGIQQLDSPILVLTPFGEATMQFSYDGGDETYWGVFQKATAELWWWRGQHIRYSQHLSEGFATQTPIVVSKPLAAALAWHAKRHGVELVTA